MLLLSRWYGPKATLGELSIHPSNDGSRSLFRCKTIERPWLDNKVSESCIPEDIYPLQLRRSPVVEATSGGEFTHGWEVTDVPDRTYIMLHPGNWARDVEGCIAVGKEFHPVENMVTHSRVTFRQLMEVLEDADECHLLVSQKSINARLDAA